MTDIANLQLRVESLEVREANGHLDYLSNISGRADRATGRLNGTLARLGIIAGIAAGATLVLNNTFQQTRALDNYNAQLMTATGSAENANRAFQALTTVAAQTPFTLDEVTNGFIRLVNLGLDPSERAIRAYGNVAVSLGTDLQQFVEAVADATTLEFERLKEFGIRASNEGESIRFTFRGVTTSVGTSAREIEQFLINLGETEFAGGLENRFNTLDGTIARFGDQWDRVFQNISRQGTGDLIRETISQATGALEELNTQLESGQLEANLDAIGTGFSGFGRDARSTFNLLTSLVGTETDVWRSEIEDALSFDSLATAPARIRGFLQRSFTQLFSLAATTRAAFLAEWDIFVEAFGFAGERIQAIIDKIDPSVASFDLSNRLDSVDRAQVNFITRRRVQLEEEIRNINAATEDRISAINAENEEDRAAVEAQIARARRLREQYEELLRARSAAQEGTDPLAGFRIGGSGDQPPAPSRASPNQFQRIQRELLTEEEAIQDSYSRRRQIILDNTQANSEARASLLERLNEQFSEQALSGFERPRNQIEQFDAEIEMLQEQFDRRRQLILENTQLTEEERTTLETQLTESRNLRLAELENARTSMILQSSGAIFGDLANLARGFAGEQSGIFRALFAANKAFAIADSIIKIQQGIAGAAALPFPANIPAIGSVIASTAGIVSTIQGTNFAGGFQNGGFVPAGQFGLMGEVAPEFVQGPANIISTRDSGQIIDRANREQPRQQQQAVPQQTTTQVQPVIVMDRDLVSSVLTTPEAQQIITDTQRRNRA